MVLGEEDELVLPARQDNRPLRVNDLKKCVKLQRSHDITCDSVRSYQKAEGTLQEGPPLPGWPRRLCKPALALHGFYYRSTLSVLFRSFVSSFVWLPMCTGTTRSRRRRDSPIDVSCTAECWQAPCHPSPLAPTAQWDGSPTCRHAVIAAHALY